MNYKKANTLSNSLFAAGIVLSLLTYLFYVVNTLFIIMGIFSMLVIICGAVVRLVFLRCPSCRGLLPLRSGIMPNYCLNCGSRL
jgi:hypothetical protein